MSAEVIGAQIREVLARLIEAGLSAQQFNPSVQTLAGGRVSVGDLPMSNYALKDVYYQTVYEDLDRNSAFHSKLVDGGLLAFQYIFAKNGAILKHRLTYFPSMILPTIEEAPLLYESDELFADIMFQRLVRFPIRFDFAPEQYVDVDHPQCHLTLGQFDGCRIPVTGPVSPYVFTMFLLRNFYRKFYVRHRNLFDKKIKSTQLDLTISDLERKITHLVVS
ncbi:DUF2290 domain-containing protein [Variovorax sp. efr-133-TYG-130]|uniref:DUF2290 domain-containing protein n=1 Tax=Variovorax sp. efr-133-TYG-130 TaxID=3040327 RepID=UPI00255571AC|nr:DUF2290 domain-containing protein [Variovorax sp. efr-133-TYG-130]